MVALRRLNLNLVSLNGNSCGWVALNGKRRKQHEEAGGGGQRWGRRTNFNFLYSLYARVLVRVALFLLHECYFQYLDKITIDRVKYAFCRNNSSGVPLFRMSCSPRINGLLLVARLVTYYFEPFHLKTHFQVHWFTACSIPLWPPPIHFFLFYLIIFSSFFSIHFFIRYAFLFFLEKRIWPWTPLKLLKFY